MWSAALPQGADQDIDVTAAQLASTTFQSGVVSDDLWVRAFDGIEWGAWKEFHVNVAGEPYARCDGFRLHGHP